MGYVNDTTAVVALCVALITLAGLIWRKAVVPLCKAWRRVNAWMVRIEESVKLVEEQMKPNGGSTLTDKIERAAVERSQIARDLDKISETVAALLRHDSERDRPGFRYGQDEEDD